MNAPSQTKPIRALLADDERLMREQLRARLAEVWPELEIVAEAKNGLEAVELCKQHKPDLCLLDIRMPGPHGRGGGQADRPAGGDRRLAPALVVANEFFGRVADRAARPVGR